MVFVMSQALATPPFATTKAASDHQCIRFPKEALKHFHALKGLGLVRGAVIVANVRFLDRKFVNHTTEMIL